MATHLLPALPSTLCHRLLHASRVLKGDAQTAVEILQGVVGWPHSPEARHNLLGLMDELCHLARAWGYPPPVSAREYDYYCRVGGEVATVMAGLCLTGQK